jgi:membrane-associated protease RseP (regulator of RpoE activity)
VRRLGFLIALAAMPALAAGPSSSVSNPAFLGIGLVDQTPTGPCSVTQVTRDSAAAVAGLRAGDILVSLEGQPTPDCATLRATIVAHGSGEHVKLDVIRPGAPRFTADVVLASRAEILRQRHVGKPFEPPELAEIDNEERELGTAEMRGRTTVIGWFMLDRCAGCSKAFDRVIDALAKQRGDLNPLLVAATVSGLRDIKSYRSNLTAHVPLYVTEDSDALDNFVLSDAERVSFFVIDARGIVRFVMPVAADCEDDDGAIDEILAAIEQAEHARRR